MRWFFLILMSSKGFSVEINGLDLTKHVTAVAEIIGSVTSSCIGDAVKDPKKTTAMATKELTEVTNGISQILKEEMITLALKKEYPNLCHVMAQEILDQVEEKKIQGRECAARDPIWKKCLVYRETQTPEYNYYWPKYFIEVSDKPNDPFPAFAEENFLYRKNREIAHRLATKVDMNGPYELVEKVFKNTLSLKMVRAVTQTLTGYGLDLTPRAEDIAGITKTAVLTPIEKLRIRANRSPDMTSYEVNIWPVGLSSAFAKNLGVCGTGGYDWSLNGRASPIPVPMTCPVAMSKDAWAYWDSGMLDYLNPNAIAGIAASTNPKSCIASNLISSGFDYLHAKAQGQHVIDNGSRGDKNRELSNLPKSLRGIGLCSFPILGRSEAIIGQVANTFDNFKGPWCSIWGPVAPRHSTHVYANDYAFANAALKFKLLAHDVFGVQRGSKERWALAYPWESDGTFLNTQKNWMKDIFKKIHIPKEKIDRFLKIPSYGRSTTLMIPGDPRMIDSFDLSLAQDSKQILRESSHFIAMAKVTEGLSPTKKLATWTAAEMARAKIEEKKGISLLPGKKRIYTIFENISCKPRKLDGGELKKKRVLGIDYWNDCGAAIRYEVRKYVQQHLIRPICDNVMHDSLGAPFK